MKQIGQYVDPAVNYEDTAQSWANHLDQSFPGSAKPYEVTMCLGLIAALWRDVLPETIETIELDPDTFADRVAAYRHNIAMRHAVEH